MLGSAESKKVMLISSEIIFQEFQPIGSQYLNVTHRRTDNLPWQYRARLGFTQQKASEVVFTEEVKAFIKTFVPDYRPWTTETYDGIP